jgi:hypothetical protein
MYFIELIYTNGKVVRLPEPYFLWPHANEALLDKYAANPYYTATIVSE